MSTVLIRAAVRADLEAVVDLHTLSRGEVYRAGGHPDGLDDPAERLLRHEGWARAVSAPDRAVYCAVDGARVVGAVAMGPPGGDPALGQAPHRLGQLFQIHVLPGRWGTGIGALLHAQFLAWLDAQEYRGGLLEVWERNDRARAFYARRGWRPDGTSRPGPHGTSYLVLRLALNACPAR